MHYDIIDCYLSYFSWSTTKKRIIEKYFLGTRIRGHKLVYPGLSLKKTPHVLLLHAKKQRFIAMTCNYKLWCVISVKLSIGKKITGLEILTLYCKKFDMFPNLKNWCLRGCYSVYRDVLKGRQVGRTFKLVNPKASVCNDSLSLNLLVCWTEISKQCVFIFNSTKIFM